MWQYFPQKKYQGQGFLLRLFENQSFFKRTKGWYDFLSQLILLPLAVG